MAALRLGVPHQQAYDREEAQQDHLIQKEEAQAHELHEITRTQGARAAGPEFVRHFFGAYRYRQFIVDLLSLSLAPRSMKYCRDV